MLRVHLILSAPATSYCIALYTLLLFFIIVLNLMQFVLFCCGLMMRVSKLLLK